MCVRTEHTMLQMVKLLSICMRSNIISPPNHDCRFRICVTLCEMGRFVAFFRSLACDIIPVNGRHSCARFIREQYPMSFNVLGTMRESQGSSLVLSGQRKSWCWYLCMQLYFMQSVSYGFGGYRSFYSKKQLASDVTCSRERVSNTRQECTSNAIKTIKH